MDIENLELVVYIAGGIIIAVLVIIIALLVNIYVKFYNNSKDNESISGSDDFETTDEINTQYNVYNSGPSLPVRDFLNNPMSKQNNNSISQQNNLPQYQQDPSTHQPSHPAYPVPQMQPIHQPIHQPLHPPQQSFPIQQRQAKPHNYLDSGENIARNYQQQHSLTDDTLNQTHRYNNMHDTTNMRNQMHNPVDGNVPTNTRNQMHNPENGIVPNRFRVPKQSFTTPHSQYASNDRFYN